MEGYSPQRNRVTVDNVQPPLNIQQEIIVGGDTQFGSPVGVAQNLIFVESARKLHVFAQDSGEEQWFFDLPGFFFSPAVAGNTVFVRAESGEDGFILALSVDAGLKLWEFKFPRVGSAESNFGGHVTSPVVANGLVLVGAAQSFRALEIKTGKEVWVFDLKDPIASSATVVDGRVYFTDFSHLYAIDLKTGLERWRFEHEGLSLLFAPVATSDEIIFTSKNVIYALNPNDGAVIWTKSLDTESLVPSAIAGDRVYTKSVNELFALDRLTGETVWTFQAADFVSLPAITADQIYLITRAGGNGQLRALRVADGQEVWQSDNVQIANAAPIVASGHVYVRTVDGRVLAYN